MAGPLDGVTVLDLSEWIAGPYATKLFADAGAEVIKLERPPQGDFGGDPSRSVGPYQQGDRHWRTPQGDGILSYVSIYRHLWLGEVSLMGLARAV